MREASASAAPSRAYRGSMVEEGKKGAGNTKTTTPINDQSVLSTHKQDGSGEHDEESRSGVQPSKERSVDTRMEHAYWW